MQFRINDVTLWMKYDTSNSVVTIAIPAWKTDFLRQSIESALGQDYKALNVLVVDDCSPHGVRAVVESFSDPRLHYVRNEFNLGNGDPSGNWNRCLELCKTEFFCLLCDDDMYAPEFVSTMMKLAGENPCCNVFRARLNIIDGKGSVTGSFPSSPDYETAQAYLEAVFREDRRQTISEFMLRTNSIKQAGGYSRIPLAWGADYSSIIRFALDGGICSSQRLLVNYRDSTVNISNDDANTDKKLLALKVYYCEIEWLVKQMEQLSGEEWGQAIRASIAAYRKRSVAAHLFEASHASFWRCLRARRENGVSVWEWCKVALRRLVARLRYSS